MDGTATTYGALLKQPDKHKSANRTSGVANDFGIDGLTRLPRSNSTICDHVFGNELHCHEDQDRDNNQII